MQKKDMIKDLATRFNISQAESKRIFDAVFDEISGVLSKGDYFTEPGFGTFTVARVQKRKGFNPTINKFMMLPPKLKPKFKSSDILKDKVNGIVTAPVQPHFNSVQNEPAAENDSIIEEIVLTNAAESTQNGFAADANIIEETVLTYDAAAQNDIAAKDILIEEVVLSDAAAGGSQNDDANDVIAEVVLTDNDGAAQNAGGQNIPDRAAADNDNIIEETVLTDDEPAIDESEMVTMEEQSALMMTNREDENER